MVAAFTRRTRSGYAGRLLVILIAMAAGLGGAGMLLNLTARPMPDLPLSTAPLEFDGAMALAKTTEFVTTFPRRADGNPQRAAAAQWLVGELVRLGYDPQVQNYEAWIQGVRQTGLANVWAVKPGRSAQAIVVYGHYDIPPFVDQGAADDGSSVGTILELARVFAGVETAKSIVFVFLDTEEYGMAGARAFVGRKPYPGPIVAGVGLDFLNMGEMAGISVEYPGTQKGYTPPWLRSIGIAAASRFGKVYSVDSLFEWVERTVAVSPTDTGMFLRRRIPALNLGGVSTDTPTERSLYHTTGDVAGNLRADSFTRWGRTAELIVRTVDALPSAPGGSAGSMVYLGLSGNRYLPGLALRIIQLLLLAPLWAVVGIHWYQRRKALVAAGSILLAEARRVLAAAACLVVGLVALKVMTLAGLVVRYDLYPATQRDPVLYHPQVVPVVLVLALIAAAFYAVVRFTGWLRPPLNADWYERYLAMATLLAALVFLVWLEGAGCAAVTFFAAASHLWLLMVDPSRRRPGARKALNVLLVLGGMSVFLTFLVLFSQIYLIGPIWWYLMLGASYGLFSLKSVLVFLVSVALCWEAFALGTGFGAGRVLPSEVRARQALEA